MDLGIDENTAFVTAGSSGLGLASAKALAAEGANVAVCSRSEKKLEDAKQQLESVADAGVLTLQVDITEQQEIEAGVEEVIETFGRLDHLVTSSGGPPPKLFVDSTTEEWYDAFDQLVMSVVWTVKAAHPHLIEGDGGTIVNITSRSDAEIIDGHVLSNAGRRPVGGLMKTLSRELAPDVRANAVLPGPHETQRIQDIAEGAVESGAYDEYDEFIAGLIEDVPLDRIGQPEELGETVAWLSSERASYVTGQAILLDGGSTRSI